MRPTPSQIGDLSELRLKPPPQQPIVLSIHGIRTTGAWQKSITPILAGDDFIHYPHDYGFFFALKMLFPFLRRRKVEAFREFYESVCTQVPGAPISLIAHSFGTYIAAKAMAKYALIKFDRIIFCGSIVQPTYDWAAIIKRGQVQRVLHDYGSKDIWVRLAAWVVTDAGPSGQAGFINPPTDYVIQQEHPNFRHSDYFSPLNFKQRWVPFLRGEELHTIQPMRPPRFNWKPWVLAVIFVACGLLLWRFAIPIRVLEPPQVVNPTKQEKDYKKSYYDEGPLPSYGRNIPIVDKTIYIGRPYSTDFVIGGKNIFKLEIAARTSEGADAKFNTINIRSEIEYNIHDKPYIEFKYRDIFYSIEISKDHDYRYTIKEILSPSMDLIPIRPLIWSK